MGFFDGLSDYLNRATGGSAGQPDYHPATLDAGTQGLIDQSIKRSQMTPDQFAAEQNQGVSESANQLAQNEQQAKQSDQSMGEAPGQDAINSAIRNQYASQTGKTVNRLKDAYSQNAMMTKNAALLQASTNAIARQNIQVQTYSQLMNAQNQVEAARAQIISSILGAGGSAAGMAMANRKKSNSGGGGGGFNNGDTGTGNVGYSNIGGGSNGAM